MSGGTAPINTAFTTRFVPWWPMQRATSPPTVEGKQDNEDIRVNENAVGVYSA